MKGLKYSVLIFIAAALFGCDDSKSKPADNSTNSEPAKTAPVSNDTQATKPDLSKAQDKYISEAKRLLPVKVNEYSNLVDLYKENNSINYKYVMDVSKDDLDIDQSKKVTADALKTLYCSDNSEMKDFKNAFPDGAIHNYYIKDEMVFSIHLKSADCDAK